MSNGLKIVLGVVVVFFGLLTVDYLIGDTSGRGEERVLLTRDQPLGVHADTESCQYVRKDWEFVRTRAEAGDSWSRSYLESAMDGVACFNEGEYRQVVRFWMNYEADYAIAKAAKCEWDERAQSWYDNHLGRSHIVLDGEQEINLFTNPSWELTEESMLKEARLKVFIPMCASAGANPFPDYVPDFAMAMENFQRYDNLAFYAGLEDEALVTRLEVMDRYYEQRYLVSSYTPYRFGNGEFNPHVETDFEERYPLGDSYDVVEWAHRMAERSYVLPVFFEDYSTEALDAKQDGSFQRQVVEKMIRGAHNSESGGLLLVEMGYPESMVWESVKDKLVSQHKYQWAIQISVEHLGAKDVREVEDARIAHLNETGGYSIMFVNGERIRVYPMNGG